jgi:hypothetical protein
MVWFGVHGKFTVSGEDEVGDKVHVKLVTFEHYYLSDLASDPRASAQRRRSRRLDRDCHALPRSLRCHGHRRRSSRTEEAACGALVTRWALVTVDVLTFLESNAWELRVHRVLETEGLRCALGC